MPPMTTRETIPNFPLNGHELAIYAVKVFEQVCGKRDVSPFASQHAVAALKNSLENDWVFKPSFVYPNVSFEIAFQSHVVTNHETRVAFTLIPTFRFPNNPTYPKSEPFVRRPLECSAPPLEGWPVDAEHLVDCFTLSMKVENPNLVRVHCQMPVVITEKIQPKHGELFGEIKNHRVVYEPADYEPLPDPEVLDQSLDFSDKWGLTELVTAPPHVPMDEHELVAFESRALWLPGSPIAAELEITGQAEAAKLTPVSPEEFAPQAQERARTNQEAEKAGSPTAASNHASTRAESGKDGTPQVTVPAIPRPPTRTKGGK